MAARTKGITPQSDIGLPVSVGAVLMPRYRDHLTPDIRIP